MREELRDGARAALSGWTGYVGGAFVAFRTGCDNDDRRVPLKARAQRRLSCRGRAAMIHTLAVQNYRTLRDFVVPLDRLNLITGPNGSGKSNVYKSLRLLAETAEGGVVGALAREGGLKSTLWAGPEAISKAMRSGAVPVQGTVRKQAVSLSLGFAGDDFGYAIDLGLPVPDKGSPWRPPSAFNLDPQIKTERIWAGPVPRPAALMIERKHAVVRSRDADGAWQMVHDRLSSFDSMLAHLADPRATPELLALRERIRSWRFYDHFRTDALAPARQPQIGTHTPVLGHDGGDLAAALQTIREMGDGAALDEAVHDAFPGAAVHVEVHDGLFETTMQQHGLLRPLKAVELSDGTLRYLLWVAALLSPRPPELLVLNEPETSLHADLLPALGRLIAQAAERTQVVVVSHALRLIDALQVAGCRSLVLEKDCGETRVVGLTAVERPEWRWLPR